MTAAAAEAKRRRRQRRGGELRAAIWPCQSGPSFKTSCDTTTQTAICISIKAHISDRLTGLPKRLPFKLIEIRLAALTLPTALVIDWQAIATQSGAEAVECMQQAQLERTRFQHRMRGREENCRARMIRVHACCGGSANKGGTSNTRRAKDADCE